VIVVGSINDDLVVTASRLPGPGETVPGTGVAHSGGGKGANQAVAAARAGASVAMVGCVGGDEAGARLVDGLRADGVDVTAVSVADGVPTGTAIVTVADGDNTIVVIPGANALVRPVALAPSPGDVVVAQLETPLEVTTAAFAAARAVGATTVLNPAPAAPVPDDVLALVDHLVVNEHEIALVLGIGADEVRADPAVVRGRTTATVHLTLGAAGAIVVTPVEVAVEPGRIVTVVDTTGAGDCFVAWLAAALAEDVPVAEALRRANAAASISVTRPGATPSMPTAAEVDAALGSSGPGPGRDLSRR
jgi:ribokinase